MPLGRKQSLLLKIVIIRYFLGMIMAQVNYMYGIFLIIFRTYISFPMGVLNLIRQNFAKHLDAYIEADPPV